MTTFGIDVSKYQGAIDWARVGQTAVQFAIARASIGLSIDAYYARNAKGAEAQGMLAGAYHFLHQGGGAAQAQTFIKAAGDLEGRLAVVDVESDGDSRPTIRDVRNFAQEFRSKYPTHPLIVYTGKWYWVGVIGNPKGSDIGPLWHSRYVDPVGSGSLTTLFREVTPSFWDPNIGGWDKATLIQFSSSGSIPGIAGRVDVDAFQGTLSELRLLAQSLPDSSTEQYPMAISTSGLKLTSDYEIDLPVGSDVLRDAVAGSPKIGDFGGKFDYFGLVNGFKAIRIDPANGTSMIAYTASLATPVKKPVQPDPTPYSQADLDAKIEAVKAGAKIVFP